ncbi:MAG: hypothetical protein A2233_00415 [Candidatus Kerfeldbacteria bacterium RIFOXYA2_FULL_38_24]|uniref:Alanine--tRNA ligase n=1 Tax=Candidatus Kerfeldbacteria bacterium RIFOXYB2_FULL_38_14 TaxID=1798547 RepID=A0A1G2BCY4_9BACT|nr:MAG: hypothetical protein A2233_00415 [Candidatus Kerfeldbacteria bacterium RIFOXYA2_FULL_38_24]OGY86057.1 MAG: hypothetical protein A2319_00620 [Candidatus Kerfeldbacteria bacterium RIFOXYB2_FULL_38_14]
MDHKLSAHEIRQRFLKFFKDRKHTIIPSADLIPENDPTLLFVNSGMYPLIPYLLGEKHPGGKRLADVQKCIRTIDIDEVGDNRHLTFFEMLGVWSLGDYFKKEIIAWTYEFITDKEKGVGLDPRRLYVTCYQGDHNVAKEEEAVNNWLQVGMPKNRIYFLGSANWWELPSKTSPCGSTTEIFYDVSGNLGDLTLAEFKQADQDGKVVEIGNDVFMAYVKDGQGGIKKLPHQNVDVGWGLERLTVMAQSVATVFETDLFLPLIEKIEALSNKKYQENPRVFRIIADHLRAALFIIGDPIGVLPANTDQGYIVRRLIRRSIIEGRKIGLKKLFITEVGKVIIQEYQTAYPELKQNSAKIIQAFSEEEKKFQTTLDKGLKEFQNIIQNKKDKISGTEAFLLFQSYGFPLEMTQEMAKEHNLTVDQSAFAQAKHQHQQKSQSASAQKFQGGLADKSWETSKLHTATHLLHQALKNILKANIVQKGSNITPERLRFDFNFERQLTAEEKQQVEDLINDQIVKNLPVSCQEMSVDEAKETGALGYFTDKYAKLGNRVKVYTIGEKDQKFSSEICGGPHVTHTGELGKFKIISEKSASSGIRRIKAILT